MKTLPFILASGSPRRLSLLADIGLVPDEVLPADIEEKQLRGELPRITAMRLARLKGEAVHALRPRAIVLSADTVVGCGRRVLPKADTPEDVIKFLTLLSGRRHRVFTGVAVFTPDGGVQEKISSSIVTMKRLTPDEIAAYAATGEGIGKAGGYAIQGKAAAFIKSISGSHSGIVGLPLFEVHAMLARAGGVL